MPKLSLYTGNLALLLALVFFNFQHMELDFGNYTPVWVLADILMVTLPVAYYLADRDEVNWGLMALFAPPIVVNAYQWGLLGQENFNWPLWHLTDTYILLAYGFLLGWRLVRDAQPAPPQD